MRKWICKLLVIVVLCLVVAVPVSAAQQGSLLLTMVEQPVMLLLVADSQGIPTKDFAGVVEKLTLEDMKPAVAKEFHKQMQDKELSGKTYTVGENKEIFISSLEEGWYLVCSRGERAEFTPFLICVPMTIGDKTVYNIQAEPKVDDSTDPTGPTNPGPSEPNIPQTGAILWPKYLLLILGACAIAAGLIEVIRGREKRYE